MLMLCHFVDLQSETSIVKVIFPGNSSDLTKLGAPLALALHQSEAEPKQYPETSPGLSSSLLDCLTFSFGVVEILVVLEMLTEL